VIGPPPEPANSAQFRNILRLHTSQSVLSAAAKLHLLAAILNGLVYEVDLAPVNPFRDFSAKNSIELTGSTMEPPVG